MEHRIENDSMGEVHVPIDALYGASTQRAVENFPISDLRFSRRFIWALGLIKGSAGKVGRCERVRKCGAGRSHPRSRR